MSQVIKATPAEVLQTAQVGDQVELIYPASGDGSPQGRVGRVEKVSPPLLVVELPQGKGYRSFNVARILGDVTITRK